jgi:hypothetical protein
MTSPYYLFRTAGRGEDRLGAKFLALALPKSKARGVERWILVPQLGLKAFGNSNREKQGVKGLTATQEIQ